MWTFVFLMLVAALALHLVQRGRLPSSADQSPAPARSPQRRGSKHPARKPTPDYPPWDDIVPAPPALVGNALARRLRERYIAARFPGVATTAEDLLDAGRVIRGARLYFEEGAYERALELLKMAIDESPSSEPLRLAQLEIAFLARSRGRYLALAREFREIFSTSLHWPEIARLGNALAPGEPLFAAAPGTRPHDHYGPWPDLPNWIQASWDLTGEVLAADFRRAVLRHPRQDTPPENIATGT